MDYFGTAMGFFPVATMDLIKVQNASPEELINIALKNNFDLSKYTSKVKTRMRGKGEYI